MYKNIVVLFIMVCFTQTLFSQDNNIEFDFNTNYEEAVLKSNEEGKPLLFYFHSSYCYSCVPLDSVLKTDPLSGFLNDNFINIKIDVDQPIGDRLSKKFKIRYLPSIVMENLDENLVFVLKDNLESKKIKDHADWTLNPAKYGSAFISALEKKQKMLNYIRVDSIFDFSVVENYVVEKEDSTTLYNQCQLHNFLNDGLVNEHFEKYLAIQKDWTDETNLNFIIKFLDDTRSEAFTFLMKNRSFFSNKYGVEFIDAFIENVINTRLYKLQPQPKYDETMSLMQILDPENADLRVYEYLIDMKLKTNNIVEYLYLERKYLKKFAPKDHERMIRMGNVYLDQVSEDYNADFYIDYAEIANRLNPYNIDYLKTLTKLYIKKGDKNGAAVAIIRAFSLSRKNNLNEDEILALMLEIDKMYGLFDSK
jgi:thiol-disulfide isomerase/thioredoxin